LDAPRVREDLGAMLLPSCSSLCLSSAMSRGVMGWPLKVPGNRQECGDKRSSKAAPG
jgi:hypothetical protein